MSIEGWLQKKGHLVGSWKKRWFELAFDKKDKTVRLKYWTDQSKSDLKGEHVITADSAVVGVPSMGSHKFCFKLLAKGTGGSDLIMDTGAPNVRIKWITTIDDFIRMLKSQHVGTSSTSGVRRNISRGGSIYYESAAAAEVESNGSSPRKNREQRILYEVESMIQALLDDSEEHYMECVTNGSYAD